MSHALPRAFKRSGAECLQWHARLLPLTRSHAQEFISRAYTRHTHACPLLYDVTDDVTPTNGFDWHGNRTRSEPPAKKKKKKWEKMLWPGGPLTLTKKSKFSKRTCPTQFFEYISILGPVSSFETQKLCKCPVSKSWLLHKYWPKSQNFQEVPILPNFSCRFHFWGLFLHLRIRNCSIVWFYNCWF